MTTKISFEPTSFDEAIAAGRRANIDFSILLKVTMSIVEDQHPDWTYEEIIEFIRSRFVKDVL